MSPTLAGVLSVLAPAVYLIRLLPQPIRLWRTGVAAGVAPLAAMNAVIGDVGWVAYGLAVDLPAVWAVCLVALVPAVWTVVLLRGEVTRVDLMAAGAWVLVLVVSAAAGTVGVILALGVLVAQGPQVIAALRDDDLSGIATTTWWVAALDALTWGSYGVVIGDAALVGYGVVLAAAAAVVLARIGWTIRAGTTRAGRPHADPLDTGGLVGRPAARPVVQPAAQSM